MQPEPHRSFSGKLTPVTSELQLTILFEDAGDGWIASSIPAIPGVFSQGRTREEAREMVLDALSAMLTRWPDEPTGAETESVTLSLAS